MNSYYPQHAAAFGEILRRVAGQRVAVIGHARPDGDCIGSQVGLTLALQNEGKRVTCWNQDAVPAKLAFMVPRGLMQAPRPGQRFDCVIATDCASFERLGTAGECADALDFLCSERASFINGQSLFLDGGVSVVWQEEVAKSFAGL